MQCWQNQSRKAAKTQVCASTSDGSSVCHRAGTVLPEASAEDAAESTTSLPSHASKGRSLVEFGRENPTERGTETGGLAPRQNAIGPAWAARNGSGRGGYVINADLRVPPKRYIAKALCSSCMATMAVHAVLHAVFLA